MSLCAWRLPCCLCKAVLTKFVIVLVWLLKLTSQGEPGPRGHPGKRGPPGPPCEFNDRRYSQGVLLPPVCIHQIGSKEGLSAAGSAAVFLTHFPLLLVGVVACCSCDPHTTCCSRVLGRVCHGAGPHVDLRQAKRDSGCDMRWPTRPRPLLPPQGGPRPAGWR